MNRHNFCLEKQSLVLQPARVECIKNVPWLDNIKLNVVTNWGPFFFYYCYYKLWESLLNSEYMPLLSTREKRWDSNYFFQSHHGVSSVMVKLDQNLYQKSHFFNFRRYNYSAFKRESKMDGLHLCLLVDMDEEMLSNYSIWKVLKMRLSGWFSNTVGYCEEPWKS